MQPLSRKYSLPWSRVGYLAEEIFLACSYESLGVILTDTLELEFVAAYLEKVGEFGLTTPSFHLFRPSLFRV